VQPSATTALTISSMKMEVHIMGTVYDPPSNYEESGCVVDVIQSGNDVSGKFCGGRIAGFHF
jgi:hypothetical protein